MLSEKNMVKNCVFQTIFSNFAVVSSKNNNLHIKNYGFNR